jgi:alanyl-tRNA synthetase
MIIMKSSEIRQIFLDYFAARGHEVVPSGSLIPGNDPTLLFTNAGMVPFKDVFLGTESRPYTRATSSQRCVRAGGKHNDLENVGYTARHHTFFEMLGNFSFGDYFKHDAIAYAWEFLTQVLKLPTERLWVTVYQDDDEAADIWLKDIGVSAERFSRCGEKDNFWSMGDTGPCGPCTEIFYDHGPDIAGGPPGTPDADGDRYIEIWNLVFMQFNRDKAGTLHPLPKPSVDTGMGLERIAAVVQGVHNNYEIDSFAHIINSLARLIPDVELNHPSLKVIADHIRACSFLIADGVIPSNEGRGYVLRRIIRRAVRHGNKLGLASPFFYQLVEALADVMGDAYPELLEKRQHIEQVLQQEENQFARTLENGLVLLQEQIAGLKGKVIPADIAFKLYDTFGFPLDLTEDIAREQHLRVDVDGFEQLMSQQRLKSQAASQFSVDYFSDLDLKEASVFHGYEKDSVQAEVLTLLSEGKPVAKLSQGERGAIVLTETPFYAESGGQVGDKGQLLSADCIFRVDDTQKSGQAVVHYGEVLRGAILPKQMLEARIDTVRRDAIRLNHTATHLLHAALKSVVGNHVQQKGSLVDADRARFDFSHHEALTASQLAAVEGLVNQQIRTNDEVMTELMDMELAKQSGAVALFGEKYSENVRVLSLGDFSKELCGGTHARRTGDIGLFKITAEYGVASGVRRIEIVTGAAALTWLNQQLAMLDEIASQLKTSVDKTREKLAQFMTESKQCEKQLNQLQQKLAAQSGSALLAEAHKVGDVTVLIKQLDNQNVQGLRGVLDQLKSNIGLGVMVLYTLNDNKISVVAAVSPSLTGRVPAVALVKHLCGKGGGRDDMAQGGGEVLPDLKERVLSLRQLIMDML